MAVKSMERENKIVKTTTEQKEHYIDLYRCRYDGGSIVGLN